MNIFLENGGMSCENLTLVVVGEENVTPFIKL